MYINRTIEYIYYNNEILIMKTINDYVFLYIPSSKIGV